MTSFSTQERDSFSVCCFRLDRIRDGEVAALPRHGGWI